MNGTKIRDLTPDEKARSERFRVMLAEAMSRQRTVTAQLDTALARKQGVDAEVRLIQGMLGELALAFSGREEGEVEMTPDALYDKPKEEQPNGA